MKKFNFLGDSFMNFSLNQDGQATDYTLVPGESYDLPADNDHIKTLVGKGFLEEAKEKIKTSKTN